MIQEEAAQSELNSPLDINFNLLQFSQIASSQCSSLAVLRLFLSLLQNNFFSQRKRSMKEIDDKLRDNILKIYKDSLSQIYENLFGHISAMLTTLNVYFSEQVQKMLLILPKLRADLMYLISKYIDIQEMENTRVSAPLALAASSNPLLLLNFTPPRKVYIKCKELGISNFICSSLVYSLSIIKYSQRTLFMTQSVSNKFCLFFQNVGANGISGKLLSTSIRPGLETFKLPHYIFHMANMYASLGSSREMDYRNMLRSKDNNFFADDISLARPVTLNASQHKYLHIFCNEEANKDLNLIKILGEEMSEKPTQDSCPKMMNKIAQLLKCSNEFMIHILEEFDMQQSLNEVEEVSICRSMKSYLTSIQPVLMSAAHILNSLLKVSSAGVARDTLRRECLVKLSQPVKNMVCIFSQLSHFLLKAPYVDKRQLLEFYLGLFYFLVCVKNLLPSLNSKDEKPTLPSMFSLATKELKALDMISLFLKKQLISSGASNLQGVQIILYDWLSALYPPAIDRSVLSHLSLNLKSSSVDSDTFLLTAQFFYKYLVRLAKSSSQKKSSQASRKIISEQSIKSNFGSSKQTDPPSYYKRECPKTMLVKSLFLSHLTETHRFIQDPKFLAMNFYDDKARNTTQAHFRLVLEILVKYCEVVGNLDGTYNQIYQFVDIHSKRIQRVLSLSQIVRNPEQKQKVKRSLFEEIGKDASPNPDRPDSSIILPFRNIAFVEELKTTLHLLHLLSKNSQFWKRKNENQFESLNALIRLKTTNFFNPDSSVSGLTMISQIRCISPFEVFLHDFDLKEAPSQPSFFPGVRSVRKLTVSGRKSSVKTDILQFSNMKNNLVSSMTNSGNLFKFQLEQLATEIGFHLLGFLVYSSDFFSIDQHIKKYLSPVNGDIFTESVTSKPDSMLTMNRDFWAFFSQQIVNIQLHLLGSYFKVCAKPESLREGLMLSRLLRNSPNAYIESHGLSVVSSLLSLFHTKLFLQKSFEMSTYLHNLVFQSFDNSSATDRPPIMDQLRRHKEKAKLLLEDFGKLSQGEDVAFRKGTGSLGFKSSLRKSNFGKTLAGSQTLKPVRERDEDEPSEPEKNHREYLKFIHDYYVNK